jgi:medium-chain acyl-[acyl-carrier-protein] hydrolase
MMPGMMPPDPRGLPIVERVSRWALSIRRNGPITARVFCFPHAGGGASLFCAWAPSVPDGMELCAIQLPGREDRLTETPFRDLAALVPELVTEIGAQLDRPFALFGHSVGALVAYEVARSLCASGRPPIHLFVSSQRAPHLPRRGPARHALPAGAFEAALARLGGMSADVLEDRDIMAVLAPVLRADFALEETYTYHPGQPLEVPMTIFGAVADHDVDRHELDAWQVHSRQCCGVQLFHGDHFYFRHDPGPVVEAIRARLAAAPQ